MKVINISFLEGVPNKIDEEEYDDDYEGNGLVTLNEVKYPMCFSCGKATEPIIRLKDIDDGCINDYLCVDCIKKILVVIKQ